MLEVRTIGFQINYKRLDKKLAKYPKTYLCCKVLCWSDILMEHNAYVKKWLKPTSKGTRANCVPIETKEQFEEEKKKIEECMDRLNDFLLRNPMEEALGSNLYKPLLNHDLLDKEAEVLKEIKKIINIEEK